MLKRSAIFVLSVGLALAAASLPRISLSDASSPLVPRIGRIGPTGGTDTFPSDQPSQGTTWPAELILWNKLGSDYEILHSEVGEDGVIVGTSYGYEPAKHGNGYVRKAVGDYVRFPASILNSLTQSGTIELWINPKVPEPVPYQYGVFGLVGAPFGHYGVPGSYNVYLLWGDTVTGRGLFGGIGFDGTVVQTPSEPTQFVATPFEPFHAAISWDIAGIDGTADKVRIYRDGQVVGSSTASWNPNGSERHDIILGYGPDGGGFDKFIVDNIRVWSYAKTDFSDRFAEHPSGLGAVKMVNRPTAFRGDLLTYTVALTNSLAIPITDVYVTDTLPISLTYVANSLSATGGSYGYQNRVITWTGTISGAQTISITFGTVVVSPTLGTILNSAAISAQGGIVTCTAQVGPGVTFLPLVARNYCGVPLYTDDFSNSASGWPIIDGGNDLYEYLDGEYRILARSTDWVAAARPGFKASDYIVAVDVRNTIGVYGSYGVVFGLSDDWSQFYTFEIYPNGDYDVWRYQAGAGWTLLAGGASGYINGGTASNRLKVERNGSLIGAYANGQLLTSVLDGSYTGLRHLGLIVSSYDQPNVDARFDNFVVYPVACGSGATAAAETTGASEGGVMESALSGKENGRNR